jgi:hypothetical protein
MPWHRYIYRPTEMLQSYYTQEIKQLINTCQLGGYPVRHIKPFSMACKIQGIDIPDKLMREVVRDTAGAAATIHEFPHYQTYWMLLDGHTMTPRPTTPYFLSRTWIREHNDGLNWLTAAQVIDEKDLPLVMKNTWIPFTTLTNPPQLK